MLLLELLWFVFFYMIPTIVVSSRMQCTNIVFISSWYSINTCILLCNCSKERTIVKSWRLWTADDFQHNISLLSLYKEFIDKMFLIAKFVCQSLWHDYLTVKFFVQRQYRGFEKLSKVIPVDGKTKTSRPLLSHRETGHP